MSGTHITAVSSWYVLGSCILVNNWEQFTRVDITVL